MTKIINFDELAKEPEVVIVYEGKRHEMKTATVDTFIENMKAIESLGLQATPVQELEVIIGIVARAFPSLTEVQIRSWSVDQIKRLSDIARGVGGEIVTDDPEKAKEAAASGNVPAAN